MAFREQDEDATREEGLRQVDREEARLEATRTAEERRERAELGAEEYMVENVDAASVALADQCGGDCDKARGRSPLARVSAERSLTPPVPIYTAAMRSANPAVCEWRSRHGPRAGGEGGGARGGGGG